MIENGRHKRSIIPREQRFCPTCPTLIQNEVHLLTQCSDMEIEMNYLAAIEKEVPTFVNLYVQGQFICTGTIYMYSDNLYVQPQFIFIMLYSVIAYIIIKAFKKSFVQHFRSLFLKKERRYCDMSSSPVHLFK